MNSLRVIIVEDSEIIRKRLVELVREIDGMDVVGEAATENAAIELCETKNPHAIILDMQLEVGSGLGVLKAMQYASMERKSITKPTIIVLTNFPSPLVERAAILLGADIFLDKTREFNKVRAILQNAAAARPA